MKPIYIKGLLAGVAGGTAISITLFLRTAVDMLLLPQLYLGGSMTPDQAMAPLFSALISLLTYGLYGILLLFTGALAVWLARELLDDYSEALIVSGISGIVAGILWIIVSTLIYIISMLFILPSVGAITPAPWQTELGIIGVIVGMNTCCCGPVFLVSATVLAGIGGGICGLVVVKK